MTLESFGQGWRNLFEKRLDALLRIFPELKIVNITRRFGMLHITTHCSDEDVQYIANCVTYKIERVSAIKCEKCGIKGIRRVDDRLSDTMCLCIQCYALELDQALTSLKSSTD